MSHEQAVAFTLGLIVGAFFMALAAITINTYYGIRYRDNPRGFCPDCKADLGRFYSNRINWKNGAGIKP